MFGANVWPRVPGVIVSEVNAGIDAEIGTAGAPAKETICTSKTMSCEPSLLMILYPLDVPAGSGVNGTIEY